MSFPTLKIGDVVANTPIIQGGMGVGISLSNLASAVANEGGIGVIAGAMIGMGEPDVGKNPMEANIRAMRKEIRKAKEMTKGVLGVNIMVALTNFADLVKTSLDEKIDVIFSGAGLPLDLPAYLKEYYEENKEKAHTKLVPIVSSARAAKILCKKWASKYDYLPDAFVVEGPKAGGHLGFKADQLEDPEFALEKVVSEVIDTVKEFEEKSGKTIPVIAAGGIYTGEDIKKFIDMGAAGVQMGTRFVATNECDADDRFKQAYVEATEEDVTVIKSPVGLPGRALKNKFVEDSREGLKKPFKCVFECIHNCAHEQSPYCIAAALLNAKKGNLARGFAFSGTNVHRIKEIIPVKKLIDSLRNEFSSTKK
ncbi:NAD(P)H-dependent flavin oxidoreductase [Halodesulfovibrio marinisediminis]|uniref:NAD(P)H-dependent flavin oxidoreductase YrpB, nitropropane dioxygenase family n=1 Tax=Halodesulfovibrio marinisediminis DSM 17456 TaxID=1121457 RepID=A0A1N6DR23_9BACT|nr:nitronate monooxygenase [Halodesulfovibrio marinisediminis]SIN73245.1 NAD(P)H-dependent flavin oxidoreductase YrpB, nitropropane dioxygenase family [Halodesulfovibrio marinisediminis DSM 17456]